MAKRYAAKLKFQVVLELLQGHQTAGQLAKGYGIHTNTIKKWKDEFLEKGPEIFSQESTTAEYEVRIAQLEQLLDKKKVGIALLSQGLGDERQRPTDVLEVTLNPENRVQLLVCTTNILF